MRFDDIYSRFKQKTLSCRETAKILGLSLSIFYRKRQKYEEKDDELQLNPKPMSIAQNKSRQGTVKSS